MTKFVLTACYGFSSRRISVSTDDALLEQRFVFQLSLREGGGGCSIPKTHPENLSKPVRQPHRELDPVLIRKHPRRPQIQGPPKALQGHDRGARAGQGRRALPGGHELHRAPHHAGQGRRRLGRDGVHQVGEGAPGACACEGCSGCAGVDCVY